jgi:hypothetical protein
MAEIGLGGGETKGRKKAEAKEKMRKYLDINKKRILL